MFKTIMFNHCPVAGGLTHAHAPVNVCRFEGVEGFVVPVRVNKPIDHHRMACVGAMSWGTVKGVFRVAEDRHAVSFLVIIKVFLALFDKIALSYRLLVIKLLSHGNLHHSERALSNVNSGDQQPWLCRR